MQARHDSRLRHTAIAVVALTMSAVGAAGSARADGSDARTVTSVGPDGTRAERTVTPAPMITIDQGGAAAHAGVSPAGADGVIWSRNLSAAIFTTSSISVPGASLAAGSYLNPPEEVELIPLEGTGTPTWMAPGEEYTVDASRDAEVIAAADSTGGDVVVSKWTTASATPDWSHTLKGMNRATARTVVVSPDGSTIAALVTMPGSHAILYYFDSSSSTPLGSIDADSGTWARNLDISEDGKYIAFMAGANAYVVDRDADVIRFSIGAGATNDPIAISGDGTYLAYGWTTLSVRAWDGATYAPHWTRSISGNTLRACAISTDGTTLGTTWATFSATQPRVEVHDIASSTPDWTHTYQPTGGGLQDVSSDLAITANGSHFAVSSWGNEEDSNPEVHVFERAQSTPIVTVDTPGSMFDVDIAATPGVLYVTACGKHIHANISGHGGDLYSIRYGLASDCPADITGDGDVGFPDLLAVLTFWGPCADCPEDVDGDGVVGFEDLLAVLSAWGPC